MKLLTRIALCCSLVTAFCLSVAPSADAESALSARSLRKLARARKPGAKAVVDFDTVCKNISPLSKALMKNAYPGHINLSDPRATGFAFVCGPDCPKKFPIPAYFSDGTQAFRLGYYGTWEGNGRPRAYCGAGGVGRCSVSSVTSNSKKAGRDGKVYLVFGTGSCRSATPGKRNGSPF